MRWQPTGSRMFVRLVLEAVHGLGRAAASHADTHRAEINKELMDRARDEARYSHADRSERFLSCDRADDLPIELTVRDTTSAILGQHTAGGDVLP